jgi:predicted Zn-dependent peptidase
MGRLRRSAPAATPARAAATATRKAAPAAARASDKVPVRKTPDAAFRAELPPPGDSTEFKVPAVKRFRLRNGLQVVLAESHKLPLFAAQMVLRTGNAANPRGKAGLANLVADMLDEGTARRSASEIAEQIAQLGAVLRSNAGWDDSSLAVSGLSEHLDRALEVWADVLLGPAFAQGELERVRENLLSTLARHKDYPQIVAGLTFARVLFGDGHPYGWPPHGAEETVKSITAKDLKGFHERYYRPGNAVLVVAGDVSEAALRPKLEKLLGRWQGKAGTAPTPPRPQVAERMRIHLVDKTGAPQSSIRVGLVGIERKHPDYHRALVMNTILGGSFKRLALNLREAKGWTYGVGSSFDARRTPGPWSAGGEFVAAHTADAVAEIVKEIEALRLEDVTDRELQETKDEIVKAFPAHFATANQVAAQMAALAVYGLPDRELTTFCAKIAAVTTTDVRKMAQKYLRPERLAVVVVGDRNTSESPLRKIAEVELRDLDGAPLATAAK